MLVVVISYKPFLGIFKYQKTKVFQKKIIHNFDMLANILIKCCFTHIIDSKF